MASLQARHQKACTIGRAWTTFEDARRGCTCKNGPTYYVAVREGRKVTRERIGKERKAAERALRKIGSRVDEGIYRAQESIRFSAWSDKWVDSLERKETTKESYRSTLAYAVEVFGEKQVRRIMVEDVVAFIRHTREARLASSTRAKHLRVLGACLGAAVIHGYAAQNPAKLIPKSERPREEVKEAAYFENDELPRLFSEFHDGLYRVFCETALKTGMRQGELIALEWRDIDLTEGVIRVRRGRTGGHTRSPKNHERRDVDLISGVVDLLGAWWGEVGRPAEDRLVFPGFGKSGYLDPTTITQRELRGAMKRAGLPREGATGTNRTFHSLRHTFAKRALESGAQMSWVSRQLGHSTIVITIGTYGHWERGERRKQAALLEDAFTV